MDSIPDWLNTDFFSQAVKSAVSKVDVKPAVGKGENYLSRLYRVKLTLRSSSPDHRTPEFVIVKTLPVGYLESFVSDNGMLEKEIIMYHEYLPLVTTHLGRSLTPECFKVTRRDVLILEDLALEGFKMKDRIERLDRYHAEAALKRLAEFHSASVVLKGDHSETLTRVSEESQFHDKTPFEQEFIIKRFNVFMLEMKKFPHLKKYINLLHDSIGAEMWSLLIKEMKDETSLKVLNHGDFWTNNILFKFNESGKIEDIKFVDFQFTRFASPAMDLHLFFVTSLCDRADIKFLTESYRQKFNEGLPSTVPKLSKEQLEVELQRNEVYGFIIAACLLPGVVIDRDNAINYDETTKEQFCDSVEDDPHAYMYRDKTYLTMIEPLLMHYHKVGLF